MDKVKYIVVDYYNQVIIFPEIIQHKDMADGFRVLSAGFISFYIDKQLGHNTINCTCYGKSVSLGIESRGEVDNILVRKQILQQID